MAKKIFEKKTEVKQKRKDLEAAKKQLKKLREQLVANLKHDSDLEEAASVIHVQHDASVLNQSE